MTICEYCVVLWPLTRQTIMQLHKYRDSSLSEKICLSFAQHYPELMAIEEVRLLHLTLTHQLERQMSYTTPARWGALHSTESSKTAWTRKGVQQSVDGRKKIKVILQNPSSRGTVLSSIHLSLCICPPFIPWLFYNGSEKSVFVTVTVLWHRNPDISKDWSTLCTHCQFQ